MTTKRKKSGLELVNQLQRSIKAITWLRAFKEKENCSIDQIANWLNMQDKYSTVQTWFGQRETNPRDLKHIEAIEKLKEEMTATKGKKNGRK